MPYQLSLQPPLAFNRTATERSKILAKRGAFDGGMWGSGGLCAALRQNDADCEMERGRNGLHYCQIVRVEQKMWAPSEQVILPFTM